MGLADIYKVLKLKISNTCFSKVHISFFTIYYIPGDEITINKYMKVEIIPNFLMTKIYEIRNQPQKKARRFPRTWKLNNMLLKENWVNGEITKFFETNDENTTFQNIGQ